MRKAVTDWLQYSSLVASSSSTCVLFVFPIPTYRIARDYGAHQGTDSAGLEAYHDIHRLRALSFSASRVVQRVLVIASACKESHENVTVYIHLSRTPITSLPAPRHRTPSTRSTDASATALLTQLDPVNNT